MSLTYKFPLLVICWYYRLDSEQKLTNYFLKELDLCMFLSYFNWLKPQQHHGSAVSTTNNSYTLCLQKTSLTLSTATW